MLAQRPLPCQLVFIADPDVLTQRAQLLDLPFVTRSWNGSGAASGLSVLAVRAAESVLAGKLSVANAAYVVETLEIATDGCLQGTFDAMVTTPVHKGVINDAGIPFTGHTEFLAERAGGVKVVMMLTAGELRVALATTHVPLREVSDSITAGRLEDVLGVLHRDLQHKFGIGNPHIVVCGLNPHAGEGGYLGREELDVISPVITKLRGQGLRLRGPVPADTAFTRSQLSGTDAVLVMYHDQGLPVLKHHGFGQAVNVTLGLPFVRTSVDHGTALELAGTGRANASSVIAALDLAVVLSGNEPSP